MIGIILTCAIIFTLSTLLYKFHIVPKRTYLYYAKTLKVLGYKVYQLPFKSYGIPLYEKFDESFQKYGDSTHICKNEYMGHDVILTNLLYYPELVFTNPSLVNELLNPEKLPILPKAKFGFELLNFIVGQGLLNSEGEKWKNKRKIMSKVFNFEFIKSQFGLISQICDQVLDHLEESHWENIPEDKANGTIRAELFFLHSQVTSRVVISGFLGMDNLYKQVDISKVHLLFNQLSFEIANISKDPLILIFGLRALKLGLKQSHRETIRLTLQVRDIFEKAHDQLKQNYDSKSTKERQNSKNLIQALFFLGESQGEESKCSRSEIVDEIMTFAMAGTQTTTHFITMMLFYIFENPEVEQKLRQLINETFRTKQDWKYEDLKKIEYLDWIQLETTRMFGSAEGIFERVASQDTKIADIPIKKGTAMTFVNRAIFYNPDLFEEPYKFKPERWSPQLLKNSSLLNILALGFSAGPRSCIGKQLALTQSKIYVAKFMQRYQKLEQLSQRRIMFLFGNRPDSTSVKFVKINNTK